MQGVFSAKTGSGRVPLSPAGTHSVIDCPFRGGKDRCRERSPRFLFRSGTPLSVEAKGIHPFAHDQAPQHTASTAYTASIFRSASLPAKIAVLFAEPKFKMIEKQQELVPVMLFASSLFQDSKCRIGISQSKRSGSAVFGRAPLEARRAFDEGHAPPSSQGFRFDVRCVCLDRKSTRLNSSHLGI